MEVGSAQELVIDQLEDLMHMFVSERGFPSMTVNQGSGGCGGKSGSSVRKSVFIGVLSDTLKAACDGAVRRDRHKCETFESSSVVCRSYAMLH